MYFECWGEQMKTVLKTLEEKLSVLGYNSNIINSVLSKFDLALIENRISENDNIEDFIEIIEYEEPTVEIIETFLNIKNNIFQVEVLEGDIAMAGADTALGGRFVIVDYTLSKRAAIIAMTNEYKITIQIYKPSSRTQNLYNGLKYEEYFKKERDEITLAYYESFLKKYPERKVKEILNMLISDYVIDEIAVYNRDPIIRTFDDESKYAENLNSYSIRYINLKMNRVDILEKTAQIRRVGKNVQQGFVNNDPYIKLDKLPQSVDFPLNEVSYYWCESDKNNQDVIAIFIATKQYEQKMYSELLNDNPKFEETAREIVRKSRIENNYEIDYTFIKQALKKLNRELIYPSTQIIRDNLPNKTDSIETIKYKYKIISDPAEFEELLYITIEDNVSRRYKYKLVENVMEDFTTIGTKLEYTNEKGTLVRKQSIADFNIKSPAIIIKRETFIDLGRIPDLLGYIYEDMKYYGTDALPIPSVEIDIYIPQEMENTNSVLMFNGTSLDFNMDKMSNMKFYGNDNNSDSYIIGGNVMPGSTYITIKYINSRGEILKENKVGNVFPRATYLPEIIPVINDKEGKEWILESNNVAPMIINEKPEMNILELKYVEKFSRVNVSYINRDGNKIAEDRQEIVQVGSNYDLTTKTVYKDNGGEEWKLIFSRPSKLLIRDSEEKNKIILVYDIEKADVLVKCMTKSGKKIAEDKVVQGVVDKIYRANVDPYIVDMDGLGWKHVESSTTSILVKRDEPNVIELVYEEAKSKVTTKVKTEMEVSIIEEKIDFMQIGKKYSVAFENSLTDFECKEWILKKTLKNEIIVSSNENENVLEAIYKPNLSRVTTQFVNMDGRPIKDATVEEAQIGSIYGAESKSEIVDNFGKMWSCKEKGENIVITEKENTNRITLKYEPLMSVVTVKYFDTESNELTEPKYETLQVGTEYKNSPAKKITDKSGKKWVIDEDKVPTIVIKKHKEENVVSIYYNKETTKVTIKFCDVFNNELTESKVIDFQIGALFNSSLFARIDDTAGGRWMLETTEPKNLMVKESDNTFKFIYGEVKTKVLVRHIDVKTQKTFVEDIVYTIKLGGTFAPNIRQRILDKNKWQWKYIGDENILIVTRENEQENIIVLTYEEEKSKVILKYRSENEKKIREDATKEVQIGKEIRIDALQKFNDNDGLGWEYVSSSCDTKIVKEDDNIITNYYKPLMTTVTNRFLNEKNEPIIDDKIANIQVGKKYETNIVERVSDSNGHHWQFVSVSAEEIIATENKNEIIYKYQKLLADVTINLIDMDGNLIDDPIIEKHQVGTVYEPEIAKNYEDKEQKAWIFDSIDLTKIRVSEDATRNVINIKYKKELVNVKLCFYGDAMQKIKNHQMVREQIGSIYIAAPDKEIIDEKMLGWILREDLIPKFKVQRNPENNIVNISYDKFLVDVTVQIRSDNNEVIVDDLITKHQVGTSFMPEIKDYVEDKEGKEWIYSVKQDNKFFTTVQKQEPIIVSKIIEKNIIKLRYKPSMTKATVRYCDPLGQEIKKSIEEDVQIGSKFTPEIVEKIVGNGNVKWVYNPNSKITIKIDKDAKLNVVNIAYEEEKALVVYVYKDEYDNELKNPKKVLVQIGSIHKPDPEGVIEGSDNRVWEYKARDNDEIMVAEDEKQNVVTFVYAPLKVDINLKFINLKGTPILKDKIVKGQLGSEFKPDIDSNVADEESRIFKFVKCEPKTIKVKEIPMGSTEQVNVFELTYEALYSEARIVFKDIDGNKLKDDEIKQMQVGTIFKPEPIQYVTDRKGIQWELITEEIEPLRVKEDQKENQIIMTYEVAKAEISVRYKDADGNTIKESDIFHLEVGKEFIPKIENEMVDSNNKKWIYAMTDPVKLTVGSINNIVNVIYQEKKTIVLVKHETTGGKKIKDDIRVKVQIGSRFVPQNTSKVIYDENDIWKFAYNSPSELIVSENVEENVVIQYYTDDTLVKKEEENKPYYNAEIEKFIDQKLVEEEQRKEELQREIEMEEEKKKEEAVQQEMEQKFEFTDKHLIDLERNIKLSDNQKKVINKLNDYNTEIIGVLHEALESETEILDLGLEEKLNKIMRDEMKLAQTELIEFAKEDRNASKILKVFEAITASESDDKEFNFIQQKKAIQIADYFANQNVADIDQANYIVERGKKERAIECIVDMFKNNKLRFNEAVEMKNMLIKLIYEKAMLNNYYKARTTVKDEYFKNDDAKMKVSREVVVMVANMLPSQAAKLFYKITNITLQQKVELDALMQLLNPQQIATLGGMIDRIQDGKTRKLAIKIFKEMTAMK